MDGVYSQGSRWSKPVPVRHHYRFREISLDVYPVLRVSGG